MISTKKIKMVSFLIIFLIFCFIIFLSINYDERTTKELYDKNLEKTSNKSIKVDDIEDEFYFFNDNLVFINKEQNLFKISYLDKNIIGDEIYNFKTINSKFYFALRNKSKYFIYENFEKITESNFIIEDFGLYNNEIRYIYQDKNYNPIFDEENLKLENYAFYFFNNNNFYIVRNIEEKNSYIEKNFNEKIEFEGNIYMALIENNEVFIFLKDNAGYKMYDENKNVIRESSSEILEIKKNDNLSIYNTKMLGENKLYLIKDKKSSLFCNKKENLFEGKILEFKINENLAIVKFSVEENIFFSFRKIDEIC